MSDRGQGWMLAAVGVVALIGVVGITRWTQAGRSTQTAAAAYLTSVDGGIFVADIASPDEPKFSGEERRNPPYHDVVSYGPVTFVAAGDDGVAIYDTRDATAPRRAAVLPLDGVVVVRLDAIDGLLAAAGGADGIRLLDLSDPLEPAVVGSIDPVERQTLRDVQLTEGRAWSAGTFGLRIHDITKPARPELLGTWENDAVLAVDAVPQEGFVLLLTSDALVVVDVSDPTNPAILGRAGHNVAAPATVIWIEGTFGQRAVVGGEIPPTGGPGGLHVFDLADPAKPDFADSFDLEFGYTDLARTDDFLVGAAGFGGIRISDVSDGLPSEVLGQASTQWPLERLGLYRDLPEQATATAPPSRTPTERATATRPSPTASATMTATATARPQETAAATPTVVRDTTPTATQPRPPTATVTPALRRTPTPTALPARWTRPRPPGDVASSLAGIANARFDRDGNLWLRLPDESIAVREPGGWTRYPDLREAVGSRLDRIRERGTLADFWAVADDGRVWMGPAFFQDGRVVEVATDEQSPAGTLQHDPRSVVDRTGRAWVPFSARVGCPNPAGCRRIGLRLFTAEGGLELDIDVQPAAEARGYGIDDVMLLHAPAPSSGGGAARLAGTQQGGQSYVATGRAFYVPPSTEAIRYPVLGGDDPAARNPGYASASTVDPMGRPVVITWVEEHSEAPRDLTWRVLANTWTGDGWDVRDLTADTPLLDDGAEFVRITAATFAPDGSLWLGSSEGEIAAWRDGTWFAHFTADNSPMQAGLPVTDLTVSGTGTIWVVNPQGVITYTPEAPPPSEGPIYLPWARKSQ